MGVITVPENRWGRCDIKTIGLLPNVLAKQAARERGAAEAWFVDDLGLVTEGASSNAWILDKDNVLRTRDTQANILRGVTRKTLLEVIAAQGLKVEERPFTPDEARQAKVTPVTSIDGQPVGDGRAGPLAVRLRRLYVEAAKSA